MTRRLCTLFIMTLCVLTACGNKIEGGEKIDLSYWLEDRIMLENDTIIKNDTQTFATFIEAVNNAKELERNKIIITKPLITFAITLEKEEERKYNLWVNAQGEGYIQSLTPENSKTYQLDENSVNLLTIFINEKGIVKVINNKIEFET